MGFSLHWLLLLWSTGSRCARGSICGTWDQKLWLPGFRTQAQSLWSTGLAAPRQVGSSWIRNWIGISCTSRRILYHWTTKEACLGAFLWTFIRDVWRSSFIKDLCLLQPRLGKLNCKDLETVRQSKVSQKEKHKYHILICTSLGWPITQFSCTLWHQFLFLPFMIHLFYLSF